MKKTGWIERSQLYFSNAYCFRSLFSYALFLLILGIALFCVRYIKESQILDRIFVRTSQKHTPKQNITIKKEMEYYKK